MKEREEKKSKLQVVFRGCLDASHTQPHHMSARHDRAAHFHRHTRQTTIAGNLLLSQLTVSNQALATILCGPEMDGIQTTP
jgi:hypothetical protein